MVEEHLARHTGNDVTSSGLPAAPDSASGARDGGRVHLEGHEDQVLGLRQRAQGPLARLPPTVLLGLPDPLDTVMTSPGMTSRNAGEFSAVNFFRLNGFPY